MSGGEKSELSPSLLELIPKRFVQPRLVLRCRFSNLCVCYDAKQGAQPCILRQLLIPDLLPGVLPRALEQFYREGGVLQRLEHRGLPHVRELLDSRDNLYFVLDYFERQTAAHVA